MQTNTVELDLNALKGPALKTSLVRVQLVQYSDWQELKVDGKVIAEGHSLPAFQVLDALGIRYERKTGMEASESWGEYEDRVAAEEQLPASER